MKTQRWTEILAWFRLPIFLIGLSSVFLGDRYFYTEKFGSTLIYGGLGLMVLASLLALALCRVARRAGLEAEARNWRWMAAWAFVTTVGVSTYLAYEWRLALSTGADVPALVKLLLGASLFLLMIGLTAGVGFEVSFRGNGRGEMAESRRVLMSGATWGLVGLLLAGMTAFNYASFKRNHSWDFSYLKTARPGSATIAMVKTLGEPMEIGVFFPTTNEVRPYVEEYVGTLAQTESKIKVNYYDKDTNPKKSEEWRVSRNGVVVLSHKDRQEQIDIGLTNEDARPNLKSLDQRFQKAFLAATGKSRTVFFTRGHGEMTWQPTEEGTDPLRQIKGLEEVLKNLNYKVRQLSVREGLANAIPEDASLVVIAAPVEPFMPEEVQTLKAWVEQGGRVFVTLDPVDPARSNVRALAGGKDPLRDWLVEMGLTYREGMLANDRNFVRATRSAADTSVIFSNSFSSHESMAALSRHDDRLAVILLQSGSLEVAGQMGAWKAQETLRSLPETFIDANRSFTFDADEKRGVYGLAAIATREVESGPEAGAEKKQARVFVAADGQFLSDALLRNPGNLLFAAETIKWLVGDAKISGETTSEEDVKIVHTQKQDVVWFYGSVLAAPLFVLLAGWLGTRKRRPRPRPEKASNVEGGAA